MVKLKKYMFWKTSLGTIYKGHVLDVLKAMPEESVNCCVTSPPYWGLRNYGNDTEIKWSDGWKGQLGLEPSIKLYIQHLKQIFKEIHRVLTIDGAVWVNIGDTYGGSGCSRGDFNNTNKYNANDREDIYPDQANPQSKYPNKCKLLIPDRFAIMMIDELEYICRNDIIWHKASAMPISAKDRFTIDHEPFYFFVKNRKYYFKQQKEKRNPKVKENRPDGFQRHKLLNYQSKFGNKGKRGLKTKGKIHEHDSHHGQDIKTDSEFRNKRTVWNIDTEPYFGSHFAVFPPALIETPIDACVPDNGVAMDPFMGSGTTCMVAKQQNKKWIGIDVNEENCKQAKSRISKAISYINLFDKE